MHTPGTCNYPLTCPDQRRQRGGGSTRSPRTSTPAPRLTWDTLPAHLRGGAGRPARPGWLGFAKHTVTRVATGATTVTEFDNVTRDPDTKTYPFAQLPKTETYTVTNVNDATGREFRSTTTNGYELRRFGSGTYTVEQRTATATEQERPVGASEWAVAAHHHHRDQLRRLRQPRRGQVGHHERPHAHPGLRLPQRHAAWLIGLPTRTLSTGCTSAGVCTTRESTFDYDDKGNPTVTVVEPNNPALKLTTTTGYGPFGVVTSVTRTDNAGHSRTETREYDNADQLYPTATINAAGHRTVIDTHSGLGVPLSTTDPNGVTTTFRYDRFGRLRETNRSDGSFEHITHSNLGDRPTHHHHGRRRRGDHRAGRPARPDPRAAGQDVRRTHRHHLHRLRPSRPRGMARRPARRCPTKHRSTP